ncbi:hypothetical protein ACJJTC_002966 [Scirpophaga incertulas]
MPRNLVCCVGNCRNSRQDAILYKFPKHEQRLCEIMDLQADQNYALKRSYDHTYAKSKTHKSVLKDHNAVPRSTDLEFIPLPGCSGISYKSSIAEESGSAIVSKQKIDVKARPKLISKRSKLTPLCQKLYTELKKSRLQLNYHKRAKAALKFCEKTSFEKLTRQLNPYAIFFLMQISMSGKKKNARRFTTEEKIIALSIMK